MADRILGEYLEKLPEQEAAWREWNCRLASWYRFNTFYTHFLDFLDKDKFELLSLADELTLQQDGSFKPSAGLP